MPHGYQTARRKAVDEAQNGHREPTNREVLAALRQICKDDPYAAAALTDTQIENMLRAAFNV